MTPRRVATVVEAPFAGQRALFNLRDRRLHLLNESATLIWDGLATPGTVSDLVDRLAEAHGAGAATVRRDVVAALDRLRSDQLVETEGDPAPLAPPTLSLPLVPEGSRTFAVLDTVVAVSTDDPEIRDAVEAVLSPLETDQAAQSVVEVKSDEGQWVVASSVNAPTRVGTRVQAALRAIGEINNVAVASVPDHLVLHAGAVVDDGRAIVMPGAANHGKTTLTTALVQRGFGYLTDEATAIGTDRLARAFPKALVLDPGSFSLFPELEPDRPGELSAAMRQLEWHVDPAMLGKVVESAPIAALVCPHWRAGASRSLSRVVATDALHLLLSQAFDFSTRGSAAVVFARLARVAESTPVYRLGYGSTDDAVNGVRSVLANPAAATLG